VSLARWIQHRAAWAPGRVALHFQGRDLGYAELAARIERLAGGLRGLGLRRGDRVAFLGYNSPELVELLFACARAGLVLVPLNWRLTVAEHAAILDDCAPRLLCVEPELEGPAAALAAGRPGLSLVACGRDEGDAAAPSLAGLRRAPPGGAGPEGGPEDPLLVVYTSGTTGRPKGAVLTQGALLYNALNSVAAHDLTSADHALTVLPMFHVGGLNIHTTPVLYAGGTVTIARRFDAGETLELLARRRPTLLLAVPTVALALSDHPRFAATDLSSLRCLTTGSSVVPEAVIRPWLARGVPVTQVYGMTETGPTAIALPIADAERRIGSCGKPCLFTDVRVVDQAGRDLPPGERGELWLRGPNLFREYWNNPEATAAARAGEWFRTGDVGHRDAEGYHYIDDRKTDVVISGGENIYPAELEALLADCPAVAEAAVVGRPDPRWGEVPVACVVRRPGAALSRQDVLALFAGRVAGYKHPRDVVFLDSLPRTAMGKVQKFELRRRLGAAPPAAPPASEPR
jgi:fatty-acyl-CoA synthase